MPRLRKAPTMHDVARAAGVSPMTVSRAFKAEALVNEQTRARIMAAAEVLGYVLDSTASSLRSQKTDFVAVTIPSINNANFADTVGALSVKLKPRGLQILLGYTTYDIHEEERLIAQFLRRKPQAIIVTGGQHTPRTRQMLKNAGVPVIEIWDLPAQPLGHVVGFSNAQAVQALVDHFGALSACQRCGVAVPGRISIAGFGNFEVSGVCVPSVTTIDPAPRGIGELAAEVLCDVLDGVTGQTVQRHITPRLLLRESSI